MSVSLVVYRIGHPVYVDRLDGEGSARTGGRWNKKGQKVIYTAQTSSLAILELLGHISDFNDPVPYQLIAIKVGATSLLDYQTLSVDLPENWSTHPAGITLTRQIGSQWLEEKKSAVLRVPSVHNPIEHNFLLNPEHDAFEAEVIEKQWYLYDGRLKYFLF